MGYRPRHGLVRVVRRLSWQARIAAVSGTAVLAGLGGLALAAGAGASTSGCTGLGPSCGDNVNVFGNGWDVRGQVAAYNNVVISYPDTTTDPATDFIRTGTGPWRYEYAPNGKGSGLCVADPAGGGGVPASDPDGLVLRTCNTGNWQEFRADAAGHLVNVATGKPVQTNGTRAQLTGGGSYTGGSVWTWKGGALKSPPPAVYGKNGSYQFASNNGVSFQVGNSPVVTKEATQGFSADGVDLSTAPDQGGPYADSGVIVDLGDLDSLFSCPGGTCTFTEPKIAGSANLEVNFYFDTDGNGGYLSFTGGNTVYTGPAGDNLASAGAASGALDPVDFSTFTQGNTSIGLAGSKTMLEVLSAYNARTSGTKDPEVWAWIGISGSTAQTAHVTSVDGKNLAACTSGC